MTYPLEVYESALHALCPAGMGNDTWAKTGMAAKDAGIAFEVFDDWCAADPEGYPGTATVRSRWKSWRPGGVTAGSLIHQAKETGWKPDTQQRLSNEQAEAQRLARAKKAEQARLQQQAGHQKAAALAQQILAAADPADLLPPYLTRKGVDGAGLYQMELPDLEAMLGYPPQSGGQKLTGMILIAPVQQPDGTPSTLEFIDGQGNKTALAGGKKAGCFWLSGPLPEGDGDGVVIAIAEGIATAKSVHQATGGPVLAALSCHSLHLVTEAMRQRYPAARLVVCADLGNGQKDAQEAAASAGAALAVPAFPAGSKEGLTDFNDLASAAGIEAVRQQIAKASTSGKQAATPKKERRHIHSGVTGVTGVTPSNGAASAVTPAANSGVTGVTNTKSNSFLEPEEDERPCFRVLERWHQTETGKKLKPGLWFFAIKHGRDDAPPLLTRQWVCSPLHIDAVTHDPKENNFGRLLRFSNTFGRWREWAMPMEMLRGSGEDLRGLLLGMGVMIDPHGRGLLSQYLAGTTPERRVICALQTGWQGDSFVLPDVAIGPQATGVIFQSGEQNKDEYAAAGTLEGWQREIAGRATGNPLLLLALSAAFSGPLLRSCHMEGGGIHFIGNSSTGKTTALQAAVSVWGGPDFRRSWRATTNGMEGTAALFNDSLLALDEISECDPKEVGAIVYALGNGVGKQRASRTGAARSVTHWRCLIISSGERSIETTMEEGGHRIKAGQSVRLLNIPASRTYGAWDNLHDLASGTAFSDALKREAATHYGHAGRAFLERLTRDDRDLCGFLERIKALPGFDLPDGEGQEKRAAGRFALMALAGELATEYGVTGWQEGEATQAAAQCLQIWRDAREGRGNSEQHEVVRRMLDFVERHGDSRFSMAGSQHSPSLPVRERAGWWRDDNGERIYLLTTAGMREVLRGFDFNAALALLETAGLLLPPETGKNRATTQRIDGRLVKVYRIQTEANHGA